MTLADPARMVFDAAGSGNPAAARPGTIHVQGGLFEGIFMSEDAKKLGVYGYAVMYRLQPGGRWLVDQDDEYRNLPAHYLSLDEALDRVGFMRLKRVEARVAALVAEQTDTADEFEAHRGPDHA